MKTSVLRKTLLAALLVSVMISGHAHAGGGGSNPYDPDAWKPMGPTYIYMNEKAASTMGCQYRGRPADIQMHKYECAGYFKLKSHGVTNADGYYRTCTFSGSNNTGSHKFSATKEFGKACTYDTDSSDNTFYAIVNLHRY